MTSARPDAGQAERLSVAMVNRLIREGVITDHHWRDALAEHPRHRYVPYFYEHIGVDSSWREIGPAATTYLPTVHSGRALVTALSPLDPWGRQTPVAVAPPVDLQVLSLHALDLYDGADVLELGTGTGHTTALLTHRLGDGHVTSVEIDPDLHHRAAQRLDLRGVRPTLVVGDSAAPPPGSAYHRVLVEHEVPTIPPAWTELVHPEGKLLTRISGGLGAGGHVLLRRPSSGKRVLSGRFLPWTGPLSPHRVPARRRTVRRACDPTTRPVTTSSTPHAPGPLHDGGALALLAQLLLPPGTRTRRRAGADGTWATYLLGPDGSWAEIAHTRDQRGLHDTRWAGPTWLLAAVERAHDLHHRLGAPALSAFGVTAAADGTHVWHHDPDSGDRWPLR